MERAIVFGPLAALPKVHSRAGHTPDSVEPRPRPHAEDAGNNGQSMAPIFHAPAFSFWEAPVFLQEANP